MYAGRLVGDIVGALKFHSATETCWTSRSMKGYLISISVFLLLLSATCVNAQYYGALSSTWNNPVSASASMMIQGMINKKMLERSIANQQGKSSVSSPTSTGAPTTATTKPNANSAVIRF